MKSAQLRRKLIISRSVIEYFEFTYWPRENYSMLSDEEKEERRKLKELYKLGDEETDQGGNKDNSSFYRTRSHLRRILDSNAWEYKTESGRTIPPMFLSLTFKENLQDLKQANYEFTKFIQRFNYEIFCKKEILLKYACVPEFQERGAIHFHAVIFNMPWIDNVYDVIGRVWGHGYFRLITVKSIKNVGYYISKYITKNAGDNRLWGKKKYFASKGLKKPLIIRDDIYIELILQSLPDSICKVNKIFPTNFCGDMTYKKFQLGKTGTLFDLKLDEDTRNYLKSLQGI